MLIAVPAVAAGQASAPAAAPTLQEELIAEKDAAAPADDKDVAVSQDKKLVAWKTKRGGEWLLVVNGEPRGAGFQEVESPTFCGPTSRVALAAKRARKWVAVLDAQEQGSEYEAVKSPVCSPDGKRLAYAARNGINWTMVVDGKPGPNFPTSFPKLTFIGPPLELKSATFSPDSRQVAYVGWTLVGMSLHDTLVVDGEVAHTYETIQGPAFSGKGQRLSFAAKRGKNDEALFVDGKPGVAFESIVAEPAFSPDGEHVALVVWKDKKLVEVVDGTTRREFPAQRGANFAYGLTFSPDGTRLAYVLGVGGVRFAVWGGKRARKRVVLDGQEGKEYDSIGMGRLTFSPDSRHFAYAVQDFGQKKSVVVLDGQEGSLYDQVFPESLSFSGDKSVSYVARQGRRFLRVTHTSP